MICFRAITEENFEFIVHMKHPGEKQFVVPNSYSLAQAWLYRDNGDVFPCAIYDDETPVGFLLLEDDLQARKLMLWRIVFPEEFCGKGYGTAAVRLVIDLARKSGKYDAVYLDCAPDNQVARHVYDRIGFVPTGEINYGDVEMRFPL